MESPDRNIELPKVEYMEVGRFDSYAGVREDVDLKIEELGKDGWRLPKTTELKDAIDAGSQNVGKDKFYWAVGPTGSIGGWSYGMSDDFPHADPSREDRKNGPGVWLVMVK